MEINFHELYLSIDDRLVLREKIRYDIKGIHDNSSTGISSLCEPGSYGTNYIVNYNDILKYIDIVKMIGGGDFGNIFLGTTKKFKINTALKFSRIKNEDLEYIYSDSSFSWYEIWILKDIIKSILIDKICPNLPLYIDTFLCNDYKLKFKNKDGNTPSIVTVMEIADGDLDLFLSDNKPKNDMELYSILFQIMASLHCLQMRGQIVNNDIKSKNILYYNVKPGGYWLYKINDLYFYIPNYGKLFMINDFGVSTLYNPQYKLYPSKTKKTFSLGSRYAMNINEIFYPIETTPLICCANPVSKKLIRIANPELTEENIDTKSIYWIEEGIITTGSKYRMFRKTEEIKKSVRTIFTEKQKLYLFERGISCNPKKINYFMNPYVIPPFEFYNDVQDILRMFTGGKRTSQEGCHKQYNNISEKFKNNLKKCLGESENYKEGKFSIYSYEILAGSFISYFFKNVYSEFLKVEENLIEYYNLDKLIPTKSLLS